MNTGKFKYAIDRIHDLLQQSFSDACKAYEALSKYDGDTQYQISLSFLNMSFQSYLEATSFYYDHKDIQDWEFEDFFKKYSMFKLQLTKVISTKDTNTSWLDGSYNDLKNSIHELNQFISYTYKSTL